MADYVLACVLCWPMLPFGCANPIANRFCIGGTTTPSEACLLVPAAADGLACSGSAYAVDKLDEALTARANEAATLRSKASFDGGKP